MNITQIYKHGRVVTIRPGGEGVDGGDLEEGAVKRNITTADTLMDLLR